MRRLLPASLLLLIGLLTTGLARAQLLSVPATVAPGGFLTVEWSGLTSPSPTDWIGLFVKGEPGASFLDWVYTSGGSDGRALLKIAASRAPGSYELRLYRHDGYTLAATGPNVTVTGTGPAPTPSPTPAPLPTGFGPRGPVGPEVPLTAAESSALATRVTASGFTAAAITQAIVTAKAQGIATVYLPAGTYRFEQAVSVPGGLNLVGAGAATVLSAPGYSSQLFDVAGDQVRFTRLKMTGATSAWTNANDGSSYNNSRGIHCFGRQNVRVDHCEIAGFCYATLFIQQATAQIDHCRIHHNRVVGLGYGIVAATGAYVLATDNVLGDNRACLSSNDAAGYRPTHWEFLSNRCANTEPYYAEKSFLDTHPTFSAKGTFWIEGNDFQKNYEPGVDLYSGSGVVRNNRFADQSIGVWILEKPLAVPNNIQLISNTFSQVAKPYLIEGTNAINISIDGVMQPATVKAGYPAPPMVRLVPMDSAGILKVLPAQPAKAKLGHPPSVGAKKGKR